MIKRCRAVSRFDSLCYASLLLVFDLLFPFFVLVRSFLSSFWFGCYSPRDGVNAIIRVGVGSNHGVGRTLVSVNFRDHIGVGVRWFLRALFVFLLLSVGARAWFDAMTFLY